MLNLLLMPQLLKTILSVVVALLILLATITIHEFGHYIVGKLLKFKIKEFAIGMGPAIYKKVKKDGEIFSIRIFPLGGFCAFEGEDEDDETIAKKNAKLAQKTAEQKPTEPQDIDVYAQNGYSDTPETPNGENSSGNQESGQDNDQDNNQESGQDSGQDNIPKGGYQKLSKDAFNNKKPWQRILVLVAGASFNFIVALIIVMITFGAYGHFAFMAYEVKTPETQIESANTLSDRDVIKEIDGKFIYFTTDIAKSLEGKKKGDMVNVKVITESGEEVTKTITLRSDCNNTTLEDISPAFKALGVASVLHIEATDTSVLKGIPYVFRFKDKENNDECTRIYTLDDLYNGLKVLSAGEEIKLVVPDMDGDGKNDVALLTAPITFDSVDKSDREAVLAAFGILNTEKLSYQVSSQTIKLGFFESIGRGFVYSFKTVGITLKSFGQLLTGGLSLNAVSGPVGTITITSRMVSMGFEYVLSMASLIGLSVAIFNLLPFPALDGARAVFVIIEWIRKKPVNRNVEGTIHFVGLIALVLFAVIVDVAKLFI